MRAFQGENHYFNRLLVTWLVVCLIAFTFNIAAAAAPLPPDPVTAWPSYQQITLSWKKVGEAAGFRIYRSYVSGRDYEPIAEVAGGSSVDYTYHDAGLINGVTYFYRMTTLDSAGNESGYSNEVTDIPEPQVASASVLGFATYPRGGSAPLIITATYRFEHDVFSPEPEPWLLSQVRLGSASQPPSTWTQITPAFVSGLSGESQTLTTTGAVFPGGLTLADQIFYVVCFSSNAGRTWSYFGPKGRLTDPTQILLAADLGLITLTNQTAIDVPSQPGQPALISVTPESLIFSWTASTDQDHLLGYDVYRAGPNDAQPQLVTRVSSLTTLFQDTGLEPHTAYTYTVRAVDSLYNQSQPSPVATFSTPDALPVNVIILASIPPVSPGDIFIDRFVDANHLAAERDWQAKRMTCDRQNFVCSASLLLQEGSLYKFNISRGSAETRQTLPDGNTPAPENAFVVRGMAGTMTFHTLVYQWDDPLVVGHNPTGSAADRQQHISVVWNQAMPSSTTFTVEQKQGDQFTPVPGSFSLRTDQHSVIFKPAFPLAQDATYRVQVSGQVDVYAKLQQIPFAWEFSTGPINLHLPVIFH